MNQLRSDTSDEEASSSVRPKSSRICLDLGDLQSLHSLGEEVDVSKYAENGMSQTRLKALMKDPPCSCGCTVPYLALKKVCQAFWSLKKERQDAVLWSLQSRAGPGSTWHIEGLGFPKKTLFTVN